MKHEYHTPKYVMAREDINFMQLFFDNGDYLSVGGEEIVSLSLSLYDGLILSENAYCPVIQGGSMRLALREDASFCYDGHPRLKLRKKHSCGRQVHLFSGKEPKIGRLEKRLCGKEGFSGHDICHLYISYRYAGFGTSFTERLYVPELCDNETLEAHGCTQESSFEEEADCGWGYLSGYAERLDDGSILVTFGKEAKKYLAGEDGNAAPEE